MGFSINYYNKFEDSDGIIFVRIIEADPSAFVASGDEVDSELEAYILYENLPSPKQIVSNEKMEYLMALGWSGVSVDGESVDELLKNEAFRFFIGAES